MMWHLIGIALPAAVVSFMIGHIQHRRARWVALGSLLIAPVLVVTLVLAATPPSPPSHLAWWWVAMIMISPTVAAYTTSALAGFALARRSVR